MRVGLDVSPLHLPHPPSLARTAASLAGALERRGRVELVRLAPGPGEGLRAWRHRRLPGVARELALDGVHALTSAFPVRGPGWRVQTVHELPWRHGVREGSDLGHRLWAALGPLAAGRVVCPTEHVAAALRRRVLPGAGKVRVVPWGVGPPFGPEPPGTVDEAVLDRHRLGEEPFALAPGAVRPKKDLAAVLRGLAALHERGTRMALVVTGGDTPQLRRDLALAQRLGLARWVHTLEAVTDDELAALYRLATAVPALARSEGFGLPVLEALACGTPPVVPPGSAQAEVAGPDALLADPSDAEAVADALARALAERERLRAVLPARAAGRTWDATAAALEAVWEELAGRAPGRGGAV